MSSPKGFTLIELLVVIAIIGILSSVVLASLTLARSKGTDAAIKSNLEGARSQAELFYDSNNGKYMGTQNTVNDVCTLNASAGGTKGIYASVLSAASAYGTPTLSTDPTTNTGTQNIAICNSSATAWAAEVPLKLGGWFCVDSTGVATTSTSVSLLTASGNGNFAC